MYICWFLPGIKPPLPRFPKQIFNRKSLSLLYTSLIRHQLEYTSDVRGGCSITDSEKLEKIQLIATRIVTGVPNFASRESLYFETGWDRVGHA